MLLSWKFTSHRKISAIQSDSLILFFKQPICISMTENLLLLDLHHCCCFLLKLQVTENFLPVSQISFYKNCHYLLVQQNIYYFLKFIISAAFLKSNPRKFFWHSILHISFCFLKYFCVFGSNIPIDIVSVWSLKCPI